MSAPTFETRAVVHGDEPMQVRNHAVDGDPYLVLYIGEWNVGQVVFQGDPQAMIAFTDRMRNAVLDAVRELAVPA